jgi:hypothetical protein
MTTDPVDEALELVGTFLRAHYHEARWDIEGTTEVLRAWPPSDPYRKDLSRAFRALTGGSPAPGSLTRLVQLQANRLVHDDDEAREYLQALYDDLHLDWEEEDED